MTESDKELEIKEPEMIDTIEPRVCLICGWKWLPRSPKLTKRCPNPECNSQRWNIGPFTKEVRSECVKEYHKSKQKNIFNEVERQKIIEDNNKILEQINTGEYRPIKQKTKHINTNINNNGRVGKSDVFAEQVCLICGYKWKPRPRGWKGWKLPDRCPKCGSMCFDVDINKGKSIKNINVCEICGKIYNGKKKFPQDHNHKTGQLRGILCHDCNVLVGWLENDKHQRAIKYLEKWDKIYEEEFNKKSQEVINTNKATDKVTDQVIKVPEEVDKVTEKVEEKSGD